MKRKVGITFVVLGLVLLIAAAGLLIYNTYESKRAGEQAQSAVNMLKDEISQRQPDETDPFDKEMKIVEIDGYGYVGYISIPDLSIELPVMAECDYARLLCFRYIATVSHIFNDLVTDLVPFAVDWDFSLDESHFRVYGRYKYEEYGDLP